MWLLFRVQVSAWRTDPIGKAIALGGSTSLFSGGRSCSSRLGRRRT